LLLMIVFPLYFSSSFPRKRESRASALPFFLDPAPALAERRGGDGFEVIFMS